MNRGLIVDLFAGSGGASDGIRIATGRDPDIGVNHDKVALGMHTVNHPGTTHLCASVWAAKPTEVTGGLPVWILWASPDCVHHSKARGGKPRKSNLRSLAWVVIDWLKDTKPEFVFLENVEEFEDWGPLDDEGQPIKKLKGIYFKMWIDSFKILGYSVDWRQLVAADYGAPTTRKRLFVSARRDGQRIIWPRPTHGDPAKYPRRKPWRTVAECINWNLPCPSIFTRKKELAEKTKHRIALGIERFVIKNPAPFIVSYYGSSNPAGQFRGQKIDEPARTLSTRNRFGLVAPTIKRDFGASVGNPADEPVRTITSGGGGHVSLVNAFLAKHCTGSIGQPLKHPISTIIANGESTAPQHALIGVHVAKHYTGVVGHGVRKPLGTVTSKDHHSLVATHISKYRYHSVGHKTDAPLHTITAAGQHYAHVEAFLMKYYSEGGQHQACDVPAHTIPTKARFGLVTVAGEQYQIVDIGMRMLSPRELFTAQGFGTDYIIDLTVDGRKITKTDQIRLVGNSVPPQFATAIVKANTGVRRKLVLPSRLPTRDIVCIGAYVVPVIKDKETWRHDKETQHMQNNRRDQGCSATY